MKATPTLYTEPSIVDKTTAPEGFAWSIINNNPTVNPTEGVPVDKKFEDPSAEPEPFKESGPSIEERPY